MLRSDSIFVQEGRSIEYFTVGIDVQSSFNGDDVQTLIDGEEVIYHQLQTNYFQVFVIRMDKSLQQKVKVTMN